MTAIPTKASLTGATVSEGGFKTSLDALIDALNERLVDGTTPITNFASTGIDDQATGTKLTVADAGITAAVPVVLPDGSASAPALSNTGDTDTGLFFPAANALAWALGGSEAARLNASGFGIGKTPVRKIDVQDDTNGYSGRITNSNAAPFGFSVTFDNGTPPDDNTSVFFIGNDTTTSRFIVWSDGDVQNHDGTFTPISDRMFKTDIRDANPQWDDVKELAGMARRYRQDDAKPDDPDHIGWIAQEVEQVCPGLVRDYPQLADESFVEDGPLIPTGLFDGDGKKIMKPSRIVKTRTVPSGKTYKGFKQSVFFMKGMVALGEAMNRIEALEAELAALKGAA